MSWNNWNLGSPRVWKRGAEPWKELESLALWPRGWASRRPWRLFLRCMKQFESRTWCKTTQTRRRSNCESLGKLFDLFETEFMEIIIVSTNV